MDLTIREMRPDDWEAVRIIYQQGIDTGQATFETAVPSWEDWDAGKRIDGCLIAQYEEQIVGWAALSLTSVREVYAGVAEVSIYVLETARGRGIGKVLLQTLVDASERAGIWTLQSRVFPENKTTIALHQGAGFRIVGKREKIARHHGVWRDTVVLERRSRIVGV